MKIKSILTASLVFLAIVCTAYAFVADENDELKDNVIIDLIVQSLTKEHFEPQEIDNNLSNTVFNEYLRRVDYRKRFFIKSDITKLEKYRYALDEELKERDFKFLDNAVDLFEVRQNEIESYYAKVLSKPFDYTVDEDIEMDPDKRMFAKSMVELKERWRKSLKYQTLTRLNDKVEAQNKAREEGDEDFEFKSFEEMEQAARDKVLENHDQWFNRMSKVEYRDRFATYVNSFVQVYDSHTGYFPPKAKEDFDIKLSGKLEGIGASLQEEDGYIKVVRIVPGSPCYIQGELEVEDLIVKVAQGNDEPVDVVDMRLDAAVRLIRGKKGTEVRLTVKKADGSQAVVPIIRDVVQLEETYAKSVMLEEQGKNIGYIKLPKFYADFADKEGRQCAKDVAVELEKLKNENIDGLILDLRGNGGGSLRDVVDMSGLFIDEGPMVQVKARNKMPYIMEDRVSGVEYNGPLIILVNSFSASASEILAAAMQDYGRAIVIGSKTTYGKGTVQRFYDLDRYLPEEYNDVKPLGAIKMTTQKFYRIDGRSTQLKGVTPDIILPDAYSYIDAGEKENEHALEWTEISPAKYELYDSTLNFDRVKFLSNKRVAQSEIFTKIDEDAQRRKRNRDQTKYSVNLETYQMTDKAIQEEAKQYKNLQKDILDFEVRSLNSDALQIGSDSIKLQMADDWHERLSKDIYLEEALNVVQDMISFR